jgi:hypothetical protein
LLARVPTPHDWLANPSETPASETLADANET